MNSSVSTVNHLLVGLPATGKTTFIAALWHAVKDPDALGLKLVELEGDTRYLDKIEEQWLRCEPLEYTETGSVHDIVMKLLDEGTGLESSLHLPDLSGETYRVQFNDRLWDADHQERVEQSDGVLLFVHSENIDEVELIAQLPKFALSNASHADGMVEEIMPDEIPWKPELATTQVKLVDLLQFMDVHGPVRKEFPIALVISAWDVVNRTTGGTISPAVFFERRLPLLYQYLTSNAHRLPHRVFGISAQGGAYSAESVVLRRVIQPLNRIMVIEHDQDAECRSTDITVPIRWLMQAAPEHQR